MTPGDLPDWGQVRLPDERRLPSTKQLVTSNRKSSAKDGKGWSKASPSGPLPWLHRIHKPSAGITVLPVALRLPGAIRFPVLFAHDRSPRGGVLKDSRLEKNYHSLLSHQRQQLLRDLVKCFLWTAS